MEFFVKGASARRMAGFGIELALEGMMYVRFQREIRRPENENLRRNYEALLVRRTALRDDLAALTETRVSAEAASISTVVEELNVLADAIGTLRDDVQSKRTERISRELAAA